MYSAGRPAYYCVKPGCGAYRFVDTAQERGETACKFCGTGFLAEAIKVWPPYPAGGKAKGKGKTRASAPTQVQGGHGGKGGGHGPRPGGGTAPHQLQGCGGGGAAQAAGVGPRPLGFQAQTRYPLQSGSAWGDKGVGKGSGKGGKSGPNKEPTVVEHSPERIHPRLIVQQHMQHGTLPRTWLRLAFAMKSLCR